MHFQTISILKGINLKTDHRKQLYFCLIILGIEKKQNSHIYQKLPKKQNLPIYQKLLIIRGKKITYYQKNKLCLYIVHCILMFNLIHYKSLIKTFLPPEHYIYVPSVGKSVNDSNSAIKKS